MKMGLILIIIGISFTIAGTIFIACDNKQDNKNLHENKTEIQEPQQCIPDHEEKSAKQKGNEFECMIADMLAANAIKIKEWNQGTVTQAGVIADNALNPDFFVEQQFYPKPIEYWLECKWRSALQNDTFELKSTQYARYKSTQRESKRKVIIAVGLGGDASQPKELFIVPLDSMPDGKISKDSLKHFFISNPNAYFAGRMAKWFRNEVFAKKQTL